MRHKFGYILITLLIIQILVVQGLSLLGNLNPYIYYFCIMFTYLGIAVLIWIEIQSLEQFHLDKFTLFIFVLSSILRTRVGVDAEIYFWLVISASGLSVVLALFLNLSKVPQTNLKWALAGAVLGCAALVPATLIEPAQYQVPAYQTLLSKGLYIAIANQVIHQISFIVVMEEVIFRGFLWGYLQKLGWTENKVAWSQGVLFWLMHIYKIFTTPLTFLITVPLLTLISTILVRRSKQVFPAILSHAIINTAAPLIAFFITS